jgi:hypothetical protein
MDIKELLNSAEKYFLNKDYKNALKFYSLVLSLDKNNQEAIIGAIISDFGFDYKEDAQVVYYYYQTKKDFTNDIKASVEKLIANFIATNEDIFSLIDIQNEFNDGIDYEDFLDLIEQKANFKEAFEDAIFSTKVIISKKWQFIDFIKKLTENGYYKVALDYLEAHAPLYNNDQDILTLYKLLPQGKM